MANPLLSWQGVGMTDPQSLKVVGVFPKEKPRAVKSKPESEKETYWCHLSCVVQLRQTFVEGEAVMLTD